MRRDALPRYVTVWYWGMPHTIDMDRVRLAVVACQVSGEFETAKQMAESMGMSRSTASRFLSTGEGSLATAKRILEALHLEWDDVVRLSGTTR